MNVREVMNRLDQFQGEDRERVLLALIGQLSPVSIRTLQHFQEQFDGVNRPFEEFVREQNEKIRECVKIELSEVLGGPVRSMLGLAPLTEETEIT